MKQGHLKVTHPCSAGIPADVCDSVGAVLARVGDKWSLLVIYSLSSGRHRFSELKKKLGSISQKVLTSTLRGLERDGYLTRTVTPTSPPRTDYELTALGRDVLSHATALAVWALERRGDVEAARRAYDRRARVAR